MMEDRPESPALILFVDDNAALLRSVERLLQMEGYEVVLASGGQEALRLMESPSHLPDLVISDIMMPKMDGFEFYEQFRKRGEWAEIPFIFLTALDQVDVLRQAYSLGADDYIVKPLDNERLPVPFRPIAAQKNAARAYPRQSASWGTCGGTGDDGGPNCAPWSRSRWWPIFWQVKWSC
jgi:CheY-like chemotaxis protein